LFATALAVLGCGRVETILGFEAAEGGSEGGSDAGCAPSSQYIDIASATLSGGFSIQMDPSAPGGEYLMPPAGVESLQTPGDASAVYAFNLSCPGEYSLWGRMHGPGAESNSFWLSVDGEPFYQWRLSTGVIWFWKITTKGTAYGAFVKYALDGGSHTLVVRNSASGAALSGLYVGIPGDVPPGNDTPCDPPHSIQLADGGCQLSCGSLGGNTCSVMGCANQVMRPAYDCAACCYVDAGDGGGADAPAD
jgi:hypothetical protein